MSTSIDELPRQHCTCSHVDLDLRMHLQSSKGCIALDWRPNYYDCVGIAVVYALWKSHYCRLKQVYTVFRYMCPVQHMFSIYLMHQHQRLDSLTIQLVTHKGQQQNLVNTRQVISRLMESVHTSNCSFVSGSESYSCWVIENTRQHWGRQSSKVKLSDTTQFTRRYNVRWTRALEATYRILYQRTFDRWWLEREQCVCDRFTSTCI